MRKSARRDPAVSEQNRTAVALIVVTTIFAATVAILKIMDVWPTT